MSLVLIKLIILFGDYDFSFNLQHYSVFYNAQ